MNIFILDENPVLAAQYHCDKHIVKMATEYAQILSTAHWKMKSQITLDPAFSSALYKPTHVNHPCVEWAAAHNQNYLWLWDLYDAVGNEYWKRYGKQHKALVDKNRSAVLLNVPSAAHGFYGFNINDFVVNADRRHRYWNTPPALCVGNSPIIYTMQGVQDTATTYREYYIREKLRFARWNHGPMPEWILKRNK